MSGSSFLQNMVRVFLLIFVAGLAITILLTARQYAVDSSATQAAFVSTRVMSYFEEHPNKNPLLFDATDLQQLMTKDAIIGGDVVGIIISIKELNETTYKKEVRYGDEALKNIAQSAFSSNWKLHTIYRILARDGKNYILQIQVLGRVL